MRRMSAAIQFTGRPMPENRPCTSESGTITLVNNRRIARDSSGRICQERWLLVPNNRNDDSEMNAIQISDPNQHTLYTCVFLREPEFCTLTYYSPSTSAICHTVGAPPGPLPNGAGYVTREGLGRQILVGVDTIGAREIVTYNPGAFGNDQKSISHESIGMRRNWGSTYSRRFRTQLSAPS